MLCALPKVSAPPTPNTMIATRAIPSNMYYISILLIKYELNINH